MLGQIMITISSNLTKPKRIITCKNNLWLFKYSAIFSLKTKIFILNLVCALSNEYKSSLNYKFIFKYIFQKLSYKCSKISLRMLNTFYFGFFYNRFLCIFLILNLVVNDK